MVQAEADEEQKPVKRQNSQSSALVKGNCELWLASVA
jgi:hypothetical protein